MLDNLLSNACKFTPLHGAVTVSLAGRDREAVLTVRDTGRGIPPDRLAIIFTPFTQVERDETLGGPGLGLALVKGLVELHGGAVTAESAGTGQGSTFTVTFPLVANSTPATPHREPAAIAE